MAKARKVVDASVTDAAHALSKDQTARARRYFFSMMMRTACFILAVLLPSPYRWIALLGAVVLPYVAVIAANAGRERVRPGEAEFTSSQKEIG
jgi:hypothetical protein